MIKLWAKIIKEDKIIQQITYESIDTYSDETFYLHVSELCHKLDIPSPIVLKTHIKQFNTYGNTTFILRDWVENINFDKLVVENIGK